MATENKNLNEVLEKAKTYITNQNELDMIKKAYLYAEKKHNGQFRKSGEEEIDHIYWTAIILMSVYSEYKTLCAGILHEVIELTDTSKEDLVKEFDSEIAELVFGITKLSKLHFSTENDALVEYYKKIIVGMSEDVRVIIVKLADRLHNMRTLWALPQDIQKKKAKETLEILAPIAHHLGMHKIKSEMEDLCLRYLKPNEFFSITERLNNTKLERDQAVNDMLTSVTNLLNEHGIKHTIKGRSKSIYSIYRKLEKGKKFSDIYDLLALRVFVDTEQECYTSLGIVHSKYRPIPKRFKDFIAMPKANGYQSLHTTVFGIDGYLFEIQFRTYEMDEIAENGVASHWAYKENRNLTDGIKSSTEAKLEFFKSIIDLNEDKVSSEEFVNSVKNEILNNNIYVFTPKGDVFELPKGSTPIDFAYRVHSRIGETTIGAMVNDNMVPLTYELKDNDIVKIITSKNSTGPSQEWLKIVKSQQAKSKIKAYFTKNEKERYILEGKELLDRNLRKQKISINEFLNENNKKQIFETLKLKDLEELYVSIGNNKYSAEYVISIIYKKEIKKANEFNKKISTSSDNNIIVEGIEKVKVTLANCCNPIPNDEIVGYITKGNGISVHRTICPNLEYMDNRMISVKWMHNNDNKFKTCILVHTSTEENTMTKIIECASKEKININSIKKLNNFEYITYEIELLVNNNETLDRFIKELIKTKNIKDASRLIK